MPSHVGIGVPEHLGDILDSRTACECQSGEGMPCAVCRKILANTAYIRQLLQICVHFLIAAYRKQNTVYLTVRIILVTRQNLPCCVQQRNVAHISGFLTCLANPLRAVDVRNDVFRFQLLDIRKGQSGQAAESENIAYLRQTHNLYLFVEQDFQFVLFEEVPFHRFQMKPDLSERVFLQLPLNQSDTDDFLEIHQVFGRRVMAAFTNGLEIKFVILHELSG